MSTAVLNPINVLETDKVYNQLLEVETADEQFHDREAIFAAVGKLLSAYGTQFGMCLVHRHFDLKPGEIMLDQGEKMHPVTGVQGFPKRWLADGTPFEYSDKPGYEMPAQLIQEFQKITEGNHTIGLYSRKDDDETQVLLEETPDGGRMHVMRPMNAEDGAIVTIGTSWYSADGGPLMDAVSRACIKETSGGTAVPHKKV